ncbi:MAG: hypothetical protein LBM71_03015 [Elusimicrobiota bacterium]|jgi:hypothetical protein|nr:hypothetical protein [Elusimicrobiota bacterium]
MMGALLAFIFSGAAPGAGQIFNGQYLKGAIIAIIYIFGRMVFLPLLIRFLNLKDETKILKFMYGFNIFYIVFLILAIIDAVYFGLNTPHTIKGGVYSALLAFVFNAATKGMRSQFIVNAMSGRVDLAKYLIINKKTQNKAAQNKKTQNNSK